MTDDTTAPRSKVLSVDATAEVAGAVNQLAALTAGNKRGGSSLSGGKSKLARVTEYDLLPEDEQGQLKWRGAPEDTYSDWVIEVVSEGPVPSAVAAPAPAPDVAASTGATGTGTATSATPAAKPPSSMISPSPQAGGSASTTSTAAMETPASKAKDSSTSSPATTTTGTSGKGQAKDDAIEIQTSTETYHVHRYFLGFGTRRSEYFARLFKDARSGVSRSSKTKLELEPLAAKAFPDLLDFLYDPRSPLQIETETAAAMHHLAIKLEMTHLQHYAKQFLTEDLSLLNLETYYQHAKLFDDAVLMDLVVQFIGRNIADISATSNFVKHQTTADLWKKAFEHVTLSSNNYQTDLHLSKLVSEFGMANQASLDATTFEELTAAEKIRKIDPDVALVLCELDDQFHAGSASGSTDAELSSIQQRCATALAEIWRELDPNDEYVQNRTAPFLVHLLAKCLQEAKSENDKLSGGRGGSGGGAGGGATGTPASRNSRSARASSRADRVDSSGAPTPRGRPHRGGR